MPQSIADEALALINARRQQRESILPAIPALTHWKGTKDGPTEKPKDNHGFNHAAKDPRINVWLAEEHLRLCGIGAKDPVILCAYGNTNRFFPDRNKDQKNYDWAAVTAAAKSDKRPWATVEAKLTEDTPNLGFISCPGGTRVKCKQGRDDILVGGSAKDKLQGGRGDDIIDGGNGKDKLKGGSGADIYIASKGTDTIIGFNIQEGDLLSGFGDTSGLDISESGKFCIVSGNGHTAKLKGIAANDLIAAIESVFV